MNCKEIKEIIPGYIDHSSSDNQIQKVEEHLCVCQECRDYLADLLDKKELLQKSQTQELKAGQAQSEAVQLEPVLDLGPETEDPLDLEQVSEVSEQLPEKDLNLDPKSAPPLDGSGIDFSIWIILGIASLVVMAIIFLFLNGL